MISRSKRLHFLLVMAFLLTAGAFQKLEAAESKSKGTGASTEQTQPYITTADAKVRNGPGTQYKVVAEIKSGTKVNVAASDGGWLKIVSKVGNPPGYIQERFARPTGEPIKRLSPFVQGSYTANANTDVREGPGLRYKTIAKITKGMKVHVVDEEGDWLKVQSKHGNPPGYIEKKYAERQTKR